MKFLIIGVLGLALSASASMPPAEEEPDEDDSATVEMSAAAHATCVSEGGCVLVTRKWLEHMRQDARDAGERTCRKTL